MYEIVLQKVFWCKGFLGICWEGPHYLRMSYADHPKLVNKHFTGHGPIMYSVGHKCCIRGVKDMACGPDFAHRAVSPSPQGSLMGCKFKGRASVTGPTTDFPAMEPLIWCMLAEGKVSVFGIRDGRTSRLKHSPKWPSNSFCGPQMSQYWVFSWMLGVKSWPSWEPCWEAGSLPLSYAVKLPFKPFWCMSNKVMTLPLILWPRVESEPQAGMQYLQ